MRLYRSRGLLAFAIAMCILWAGLIFAMSGEAAPASAERSTGLAEQLLTAALPGFLEQTVETQVKILAFADHLLRKTAHFGIYAVLGGLLCFASLGFEKTKVRHLWHTLLVGTIYAASDELHQAFVPGRGPAVTDVLLDSIGVFCGIGIMLFIGIFVQRKKNRC